LNCWDLDGDGLPGVDEDTNGDGVVDALDCQRTSGGGISKSDIYVVFGPSGGASSTATCADTDDVLLTGGCNRSGVNCLPLTFTDEPRSVDDPTVAASWYCESNCGSVEASAVCLVVN